MMSRTRTLTHEDARISGRRLYGGAADPSCSTGPTDWNDKQRRYESCGGASAGRRLGRLTSGSEKPGVGGLVMGSINFDAEIGAIELLRRNERRA